MESADKMKQGLASPRGSLHGKTILVVDDDPLFCELAKVNLGKAGAHTISANNGYAAIDVLQYANVDAATIDLFMPEMDGFRLMAHMRRTPSTQEMPLMVVSSRHDEKSRSDAEKFDILSYQIKPIVWPDLIATLAFALDEHSNTSISLTANSAA